VATVADALRHLIAHAPALSDTNRAEFADAVDAEYGKPEVGPDQAEAQAEAARQARAARMAELQAELDQAKADQARDDEARAAQQAPAPLGSGGQAEHSAP
jgi:hypothetical protein